MNRMKKCVMLLAIFVLVTLMPISTLRTSGAAVYDSEYQVNMELIVEGAGEFNVRTVHLSYDGNIYVSLRDMAYALSGTDKQFQVEVGEAEIRVTTGKAYETVGTEDMPFTELTRAQDATEYIRTRNNNFYYNGSRRQFYTMIYPLTEEISDCYMFLTDFALLFDLDIAYDGEALTIDPEGSLSIDPRELEEEGYMQNVNALLVGDITNGEVYYSYNADSSVAMASTTKLMTYLVVMEAVSAGEISLSDTYVVSESVHKLSY